MADYSSEGFVASVQSLGSSHAASKTDKRINAKERSRNAAPRYRFDAHELDTFDLPVPAGSGVAAALAARGDARQLGHTGPRSRAPKAHEHAARAAAPTGLNTFLRNALNIAAPHKGIAEARVGAVDDADFDHLEEVHNEAAADHVQENDVHTATADSSVMGDSTAAFQLRTGEDAINFFAQHGANSPIKFVHLIRAQTGIHFRPYDLVVLNPRDCGADYFTMSNAGLVHVAPGEPSEFIPLSEWMRQGTMFNMLRSIRFYKHYLPAKCFQIWRDNVRFKLYCQQRRKISQSLFLAQDSFAAPLLDLRRHMLDMQVRH
jgi:hypothetical protein